MRAGLAPARVADHQTVDLGAATVNQIHERTRNHDTAKHRRENTEAQHHGEAAHPEHPRVLHFGVESDTAAAGGSLAHSAVHLLVLDARRMPPACLKAAFAETKRLRTAPGFKHGVLVCNLPQLAVIQGATEILSEHTRERPPAGKALARIQRAAGEMSEFIHALLMLSRESQPDTEPGEACDVGEILPRVAEEQRELLNGRTVDIECQCCQSLRVQAQG